jgi:isocitrate dehydrogenase kinase/phosphatase
MTNSADTVAVSTLASRAAAVIRDGFEVYESEFNRISRRARSCFEQRDWKGAQQDALARLDLRARILARVVEWVRQLLGNSVSDRELWSLMKVEFSGLIAQRTDWQFGETFFNSVTRRIFDTVGVDPGIEFVASDYAGSPRAAGQRVYRTYKPQASSAALVEAILRDFSFSTPWRELASDVQLAGEVIDRHLATSGGAPIDAVDMAWPVFYRGKGAYLVGRMWRGGAITPFILALLHPPAGIELDAVLLEPGDASNVFSFTRSYFHVETKQPLALIEFLKSILPQKRISEIYTVLGRHKHGKTELYRELLQHLDDGTESFVPARGDKGLVMVVFTLPSLDVVFKVIRDEFAPPKNTTQAEVKKKYALVFRQDRAGRLVDAQEFEHLAFDRSRFAPELLEELLSTCAQNVSSNGDQVHIRHLYAERRVVPLNLFVREMSESAARAAIIDYGQCIRDLAATNTFPGDLLLKNFGVTRSGRIIFYDYDELCLLTECNFRDMPQARSDDEEISGEPWFYVGEHDVFPEEFLPFLGLSELLKKAFLDAHQELLKPAFWRRAQEMHRAGEIVHIFPYRAEKRLRHRP